MSDWNAQLIATLRGNNGEVPDGPMAGRPLLILTTKGAKTGQPREAVLTFTRDDGRYVVGATAGGSPTTPSWYYNLLANPPSGRGKGETFTATASVAPPGERERSGTSHVAERPEFAEYPEISAGRSRSSPSSASPEPDAMPRLLIGLGLSTSPGPASTPLAEARAAEDPGLRLCLGVGPPERHGADVRAVDAAVDRAGLHVPDPVRTRVLAMPYRTRRFRAKMAETLDRLSAGQLILGLGGGYFDEEFRAFGLPIPTNRDKVDGVAEQIAIARAIWSEPGASYAGRLYRIDDAVVEPKPERRIPVWLRMYKPARASHSPGARRTAGSRR